MPSIKSELQIMIKYKGKSFTLNCSEDFAKQWRIKNGRSWSTKKEYATITNIFDTCRRWVCDQVKGGKL
jgi:hypothetical protein